MADQATEHISVAAPPERCFAVAADLERYPEWAADIKEIEVKERDDQGRPLLVTFRAAAFGRSTSYTLAYDYSRRPPRPVVEADPGRHHHQARRQLRLRPRRGRRHRRHLPPRGGAAGADPRFHQDAGHEPHHGDGHARAEGAGRVHLVTPDAGPPAAPRDLRHRHRRAPRSSASRSTPPTTWSPRPGSPTPGGTRPGSPAARWPTPWPRWWPTRSPARRCRPAASGAATAHRVGVGAPGHGRPAGPAVLRAQPARRPKAWTGPR